jgi:hypothetical protein
VLGGDWGETGGLVGVNIGTVTNCYSTTSVTAPGPNTGGLVGHNYASATVANCFATGNVSGNNRVGGLCGRNYRNTYSGCIITNSYSTGSVSGNTKVGGFCGENTETITNCFWDIETSGMTTSSGGTGLSTEDMQKIVSFTDTGWDFIGEDTNGTNDIWRMCNGMNYPRLQWEPKPVGDFGCPDGVEVNDLLVLIEEWLAETMAADMAPNGGDGKIDLQDWNHLANAWLSGPADPGWDIACDLYPECLLCGYCSPGSPGRQG